MSALSFEKGDYVELKIKGKVVGVGFSAMSIVDGTHQHSVAMGGCQVLKRETPEVEPPKGMFFMLTTSGNSVRTGYHYLNDAWALSRFGENYNEGGPLEEFKTWAGIRKLYPRERWNLTLTAGAND